MFDDRVRGERGGRGKVQILFAFQSCLEFSAPAERLKYFLIFGDYIWLIAFYFSQTCTLSAQNIC